MCTWKRGIISKHWRALNRLSRWTHQTQTCTTTVDKVCFHSPPFIMLHHDDQTSVLQVVHFITNDFTAASENYTKSTTLDSTFIFLHIQVAVAQYKMGNIVNSMVTFRWTMTAFPNHGEVCNY